MVNVNKLKGKITEREFSVEKLSNLMGINKTTFYRKLNNRGETFSIKEVSCLVKELKMSDKESMDIFFALDVADMQ